VKPAGNDCAVGVTAIDINGFVIVSMAEPEMLP
jgi:hypothetical protein